METLARRPAPGSPGVFDVPVAIVGWDRLPLIHNTFAGALETIDRALDHLIASLDEGGAAGAADLVAVERLGRRLDSARLRLVAKAERERVAERAGHTDTGSWVATTTKGDRRTAARDVHLATALGAPGVPDAALAGDLGSDAPVPTLDLTRGSLDQGELSAAHARVIAQAMAELPEGLSGEERQRCEAELVRLAAGRSPAQLRLMARRVIEQIEPDLDAVDAHEEAVVRSEEERAYEASAFWIKDNQDGTMTGQFTVPWASGMVLKKVIDAMTAPRRQTPGGVEREWPVDGAAGEYKVGEIDWQHRRGAALADLLLHLPTDHLSGKIAATLLVSTRLEDLRGELARCGSTDAADVVSAGTARRLACGAGIIPAVLDGDSLPLDLGRQKRVFTEAQRVALSTLYVECASDGCDRPFSWCEIHHLEFWQHGGCTDLANGVPLCGRHHHMIDSRDWRHTVRAHDDGRKSIGFHRRT